MRLGILMRLGTYCRGGPPWPPGAELDLGNTLGGKERNSTPGGHGGPPLQYVPRIYLMLIVIEYVEGLSPDSTRMM